MSVVRQEEALCCATMHSLALPRLSDGQLRDAALQGSSHLATACSQHG